MAITPLPSSSSGRNRRAPMAEINVTPMVDVMLVLLIIFMVTAPLMMAGVPVNLPDSNAKPLASVEKDPIELSIDASGGIFLGDEAIAEADMPARIAALAPEAGAEPPQVYLRADTALDYGSVMRVMGALNRAGLNRVSLVTISGADKAK
jgi:biopolymer transport protein TolR